MIKVLFFARLREQLGTAELELPWSSEIATVRGLQQYLAEYRDNWGEILSAENIICAVNQEQADAEQAIADGDELAFFPPVTGG
jgi:molybdopterin synthase sulfur carrier subunit